MKFTKRNHYNPCFWTALWNQDYYGAATSGTGHTSSARTQEICALSVKSGDIFHSTVENIHFDKNLGVAEISREAVEDFARRYHPDRYQDFVRDNASAPYPVFIDFEDILSGLEKLPPYRALLEVARRGRIQSAEEQANLGCFVVLQLLRSHAIMNSMIEWHEELGRHKFEHFVTLRWILSDPEALFALVEPIATCRWTLFPTDADAFPLCDSAVLVKPDSVMIALSPRLLLEIQPRIAATGDQRPLVRPIERSKVEEFRRRTIGNTFREIIGDAGILEHWRGTPEFRNRVVLMKDVESYNRLVRAEGARELWHVNAYGNRG